MDIEKPATSAHLFVRRAATLLVASAIPLSLVGAATAAANPLVPEITIELPVVPVPTIGIVTPVADPPAPPVSAGRNDLRVNRPIPDPNVLAPVIPERLRLPDPTAPAPPVAPIEAPPGTLRVGSVVVPRPDFLPPDIAEQINDAIAGAEAGLAQTFDSAGFEPSRSDRMASDVVGSAAIGASVGSLVASPIASVGLIIGGISGAIAGIPMFPAGMIATIALGAAIGYAFVAAPAIAAGAVVGAGVGLATGLLTPPTVPAG
ncbi:hypothetical protein [Nocardia sp. CNY236]|uniref:hypothetical protein n=1 Tax=Nocardia sp. CNY236 TaxID=1169152 RepID=UPI000406DDB3|nr:hypothetical protein [Nocardia sp. CNY236]